MIAALEREEHEDLWGDPGKVTIFGQLAGALSVPLAVDAIAALSGGLLNGLRYPRAGTAPEETSAQMRAPLRTPDRPIFGGHVV